MSRTPLWLLASLAFASVTSLVDGSPLKVMSAPNLLRVGTAENVFVECQDCEGEDIRVEINVTTHPTKNKRLATTSVTLTSAEHFQALVQIKIPAGDFSKDANMKQYVYLQAQFPDRLLEKVVLVSFQSGYIFIQTDKTLYTPNSKVHFRMFAVTPRMEPVERDEEIESDASIAIEFVTPEGLVLPLDPVSLSSGIHSGYYQLDEIVSTPQESFSAKFEVKEYGGEMVEAELRGIQIVTSPLVTSPYTIHFKRTPTFFKPGMTFDVAIEVTNPDETPAQGVAVVVNPGEVQGLTAANGYVKLTVNTVGGLPRLMINAKTNDPRISPERQAEANMVAVPYNTKSQNYIHIGVDTAEVELGNNLKFTLSLKQQSNQDIDITYLILSRGQLIKHGRYRTRGQVLISLMVPITKDLLPSFRIIAYYHLTDNEVVSDSVWVDVKDSCMGSLELESSRLAPSYEPRRLFSLKVTGDPEATVGLVAVDKVQKNKHRLTQKKVWDIVEKYDTGCTPGGGKDSMSVFYDAGLLFKSGNASGTPYRTERKCPVPTRRKQSPTIMPVTTSLVSHYDNELQHGMRETSLSYTCQTHSECISDGASCAEAFLHCCTEVENLRDLAHSEDDDDSYLDINEIVPRTRFPESWLWSDIKLRPCPRQTPDCSTSFMKMHPLPDSITTWQFTGISLSRTHGICIGEPLDVIVRKDFFIDLRLPYSAVRGEQLEVKAILHNYSPDVITVRVYLIEEEHVCSAASKHARYRQEVRVGRQTTRSVPFVIIPMKEGKFRIEVKAAVKDSTLSDGVMKMLQVVPEGVLVKQQQIITLDPSNKGVGGTQVEIINSEIPKKYLVPNTPTTTQISVTGRGKIAPMVENAISGQSMGSLIYQPAGCGEQNMIHMTLPVIAATYLDKTNQWEAVGFEKRNKALQHIQTGYKNELAFRKYDGSFAVWAHHKSSSWLTAYVTKVFAMVNGLMVVNTNVICDAVKYLILNAQQYDGVFREVGNVNDGEMMGDVRGSESEASMTAFILIAMQESRTLCAATVSSLPGSVGKAVQYLERRLDSLTNPYAVAMTSYALANEGKLNREVLFKFASPELSHWPVPKGHIYTLEATAYALLALVKVGAFEEARPIVRWFNQQQKVGGGFGSTQATIIVYQAVAEYWASAKEPEYDLYVDILLPGKSKPTKFYFNQENSYATRRSKINDINQDVKVTATGSGEATLTMVSMYYALPKEKESDCQKFNMSVQLIPEKMDADEKIYKLKIEVLYKDREQDAGMSVLDIGLLTGFTVNTNDLDLLSKGHVRNISKYEMNTGLSERGSLIIYLDKVSHTRPEEITFRIHQKMKVDILQPATVSVYEYYDQRHCVKFYHPERKAGQLLRLCRNDERKCAEENCSMQKKGKISNDLRIEISCETTPTSKIDFVYKVRLENFTDSLSTDICTMRILEVIKEGSFDVGSQGKQRTFLSSPHCRESLDLGKDKMYLIMGTSKDIHRDEQHQSYQYVLGERTWIEYWPTEAKCQVEEHRPTCLGLEEMVQLYELFVC
ncbi:complement C3-like [Hippoglossus hippoglossus]|uniref:complement C3-like n=1 Tax=Hippoglossus hippoglossus TaxID=8267 RepID=UPI00148E7768|nr:complement C3-like [Hippoglossus hippoglossus]